MQNTPKAQDPSAKSLFNELEWRLINLNGCNLTADETLRRLLESHAALDALGLVKKEEVNKKNFIIEEQKFNIEELDEEYAKIKASYAALAASHKALAASHGELLDKLQKIDKIAWGYDGDCGANAIIGDLSHATSMQSSLPLKGAE